MDSFESTFTYSHGGVLKVGWKHNKPHGTGRYYPKNNK